MVRLHCVTLPVDDLARAASFYRDGLGLIHEDKSDHAVFSLQGSVVLMLLPRAGFASFIEMAGQGLAPRGSSEVIMSYFASSRDEVDEILERAIDFAEFGEAAEERPWGYSGYLTDPDGHIWEILYNEELLRDYYGYDEDIDDYDYDDYGAS